MNDPFSQDRFIFLRLLGWLIVAILLTAFATPYIFNALVYLGRTYPSLEFLREIEFESVASRCALFSILLCLASMLRNNGMANAKALGLLWNRRAWKDFIVGSLLGCFSIAFLLGFGLLVRAYFFDPPLGLSSSKVVLIFVGGFVVGVLEELIFRGAIYGILRRGFSVWSSALLSSAFFSLIHFAKPNPSIGVVHGHWDSGFHLLRHAMPMNFMDHHVFPFVLTLFLMGLSLCILYESRATLFLVIGLHMGWVWMIRLGQVFFGREIDYHIMLFGMSDSIQQSYAALAVMLFFTILALWHYLKVRRILHESN